MKINYLNIENLLKKFNNDKELLDFIKESIYYLYTHNKNYNGTQWIKIQDLKDIFDNIDMEEKNDRV